MPLLKAATNSSIYNSNKDLVSPVLVDNQALLHENRTNLLTHNFTAATSSSSYDSYTEATNDQISTYVVHDGDTIPDIAKMFDVSPNTIRWANNLSSKDTLTNNQQLIILPISGLKYIVKSGDTAKSIAASYKGDEQEILAFNDLDPSQSLTVGDEIIIPNGEALGTVDIKSKSKNNIKTSTSKVSRNLASKAKSIGYFIRPIIGGIKTQGIHGNNGY